MRPEALSQIARWRDAILGVALALLGLWWALTALALVAWLGWAMVAGGLALTWTGVQRARFRPGGGGPGVVQVVERRLAYFGPLTGGMVDLDEVAALDWDAGGRPGHWILTGTDGAVLAIPSNAEGAEALLDAFAALPGLSPERVLSVRGRTEPVRHPVWRRPGAAPALTSLPGRDT